GVAAPAGVTVLTARAGLAEERALPVDRSADLLITTCAAVRARAHEREEGWQHRGPPRVIHAEPAGRAVGLGLRACRPPRSRFAPEVGPPLPFGIRLS